MKKIIFLVLPILLLFAQEEFERKDPREIIERVRIYKLTEALDLSEEQAAKLFPHLKEMRKNEQEFQRQRMELLKDLKDLLNRKADESEIIKVLNRYQELQKKRMESQINEIEGIKKILTPEQQAKFLIFQEEFEQEIRELIKEVRSRHRFQPK
jgi:Spy/CpxP family protein refolding chaperone|uniref:Periplasmic heavy metal sensor n=1 Tax=candidate division WOR-3 bacterium TaxID=2052148 RepID=A0A7V3VUQ3_UNCW3